MSYGYYRNSGISWFRDYADAVHKYDNTTDIRGRTEEPKRPLGHRKLTDSYSIRKREDGAIECVLWKTPVITFNPDNSVDITDGTWTTLSTANFIEEVMGYGVRGRVFNGHICLMVGDKEYRLEKDTKFKLVKNEQGYWTPANAPKAVVHQINRAGSNKVMKRYKEFTTYVENVIKLRVNDQGNVRFSGNEYKEAFGVDGHGVLNHQGDLSRPHYQAFMQTLRQFVTCINDTNEETKHVSYYHALLILARSKGNVLWAEDGVEMHKWQVTELPNFVRNLFWGIHREECFKEVELPDGELKRDQYLRFFQSGWEKFHEGI
jgi:hypothetical protein